MKNSSFAMAILSLLLGGMGQAKAEMMYTFSYSDGTGNTAFGTLSVTDSGLGDTSLLATSGTLTVTSSSDGGGSVGTYNLLALGPGITTSPTGLFYSDDLIYPTNNAANGASPGISSSPSYLTNDGLLFGQPGTGSQTEVNIFGNGGGDYAFYTAGPSTYNIQVNSGGTFDLAVVTPAPSSLAMCGLSGLVFLGYLLRRRRAALS